MKVLGSYRMKNGFIIDGPRTLRKSNAQTGSRLDSHENKSDSLDARSEAVAPHVANRTKTSRMTYPV